MNYGPGRIWWRGEHARLEKWWRCSPACISKLYLDRHHQSKLKLKFNLCLSNFCQKNFQNIVTWGVELQSRNTIFACISMESLVVCSHKLTMTHWLCVTSLTREFGFHHYNTLPSWLLHHNNALILYSTYLQKYIFPLNLPLFCKTEFFRPQTMFMVMLFNVLHLNTWGNSNTSSLGYNMESPCPYIGLANRWRYTIN